jgi:ABC-type multidrug transport system fused ATPase/permease subunit
MKEKNSVCFKLIYLWTYIGKKYKKKVYLIFIFTILSALFEFISIGAIIPLLGILSSPNEGSSKSLFFSQLFEAAQKILPIDNPILFFALVFGCLSLTSGVIRLYLLRLNTSFSFLIGESISADIYRKILSQNYSYYLRMDSSNAISVISNKINNIIYSVVLPTLVLISSLFIAFWICICMLFIEWLLASIIAIAFGAIYILIIKLTRKRINNISKTVAFNSTKIVRLLQHSFGAIRDVIIDSKRNFFIRDFNKTDSTLRSEQAFSAFLSASPRYIFESIGIFLIALLCYFMSIGNDKNSIIPIVGALALAAQRLLPLLQQSYHALVNILSEEKSLEEIINYLDLKIEKSDANNKNKSTNIFLEEIKFVDVTFKFHNDNLEVLKDINFRIKSGEKIGIIGSSGAGKSTFMDLFIGLLEPTTGEIYIDGNIRDVSMLQKWLGGLAHVPQDVFLVNGSISENIALGDGELNDDKVRVAAEKAELSSFIESLPNKYSEKIGEQGIRLSGGQKQRIGIARALYKDSKVLVLDEATSALDHETELSIMKTIYSLGPEYTIILITHRPHSLYGCDSIFEIKFGSFQKVENINEAIDNYRMA